MPTVTREASQGTYVNNDKPTRIFYSTAKQRLYIAQGTHPAYLYTPIPPQILGRTIVNAYVQMVATEVWAGSRTITIRRHENPSPTTYSKTHANNEPLPMSASSPVSVTQAGTVRTWRWDVTDEVQAIANGGPFYGWRFTSSDPQPRPFRGCETTNPPRLVIEYSLVPTEPEDLSPDGGLTGVVSVAAPVFTWNGSDDVSAVQVQIDETDGDFTTPLWDSGEVAVTVDGVLNTATEGWTGLLDSERVDWRVRRKVSGHWSDWSEVASFGRKVWGTLTVSSPGATSTDPTPTTGWSYTGTQTAFQVIRTGGGRTLDNSGRQGGTETAWLLDVGATEKRTSIRDYVRVWDDEDRLATPGDPEYLQKYVAWTFDPNGTVPGIDALTVTQDAGGLPAVDIAWSRDVIPDEWIINRRVDGETTRVARIDGTEHMDGSGSWSLRDWNCPPNKVVSYRVLPVTSGETASWSASLAVNVRTDVRGMWLIDTINELWVCLGGDAADMPLGESAAVYSPPMAQGRTKRHYALLGRDGSARGILDRPAAGKSVEDQISDLRLMRRHPVSEYRLVWGYTSIPVVVRGLTWDSQYGNPGTVEQAQEVSFEAYQSGEFEDSEP